MHKKLLVLALAAAPLSAFAQESQVTIYGDIEFAVSGGKMFGTGPDMKTVNRIDDTGSLIGFRGSESLGSGLNAIWQVESYVSADGTKINGGSRANQLAGRDTFLGLQSQWGKVRLGRLSNYQNSDMETMDAWEYQWAVGINGMGIMTRYDGRFNNAVRYDMPTIAGFDLSLLYSADEQRQNNDNQFSWTIGGGYTFKELFVKAGYTQFQEQNGKGDEAGNYWRVEAGYAGTLSVIGAYQQSKQYGGSATGDTNSIWMRPTGDYSSGTLGASGVAFGNDDKLTTREMAATVSYQFGNFTPRASFVWGDNAKVNGEKLSDSGYQQYIAGVDYQLSKRSKVYASYGYISYDGNQYTDGHHDNENSLAVGMVHLF